MALEFEALEELGIMCRTTAYFSLNIFIDFVVNS